VKPLNYGLRFKLQAFDRGPDFETVKRAFRTVLLRLLDVSQVSEKAYVYGDKKESQEYRVGGAIGRLFQVRVDERDKIDVDLFPAPCCPTRRRSVLSGA
jgi:hypothetical protein